MSTTIDWGNDKIIDSRDLIKRHEELQDEYDSLVEALEEATLELEDIKSLNDELSANDECETSTDDLVDDVEKAQEALDEFNQSFEKDELDTLTEVIAQAEDSPDWSYGESLILDSYFTDYITDLIHDCYDIPKEMNSGKWPWNHLKLDYDSAAEGAKSDYIEVDVGGSTYYIRA